MAVQKSKVSRSRRDQRRTFDRVKTPTLGIDEATGEVHLRHHMTKDGYYRGKQIIHPKIKEDPAASEPSV